MEFENMKLGDICTVITDGSHSSPKAASKGFPMLSVKDMRAFDFDYEDAKIISDEDYESLVKNGCKPLKDDVLIAKDGNSCLEYCFVFREPKEVVLLSSIAILRPNKEIVNPYYLMYYLGMESTKEELRQGYLSGSAIPRVVLKDFRLYPVQLPPLEKQNKVVSLINAINKKVESNESIISILEQLAQTLFKRWFVDFEFPNENGEPYKSSGGEMVEIELGEIPIDWNVKTVLEFSKRLQSGGTPRRKEKSFWVNGTVPWLKTKEIKNNYIINAEEKITELGLEKSSAKLLEKDTILIAMYGATAGQLGFLKFSAATNQACCGISTEYPNYLFQQLLFIQNYIETLATGSAQQNLSKETISNIKIKVPSKHILDQIERLLKSFSDVIEEKLYENQSLENLRDTLLPKLLSGEIKLPDETEVTENVPVS